VGARRAILLAWVLGAPIIALSMVTKVPLDQLSASIGRIVAILALLPPWILIVLVTGRRGLPSAWPLAVVGSLSYILGQFPTSQWLRPYLPDIIGTGGRRRPWASAACQSRRAAAWTLHRSRR
jgi:hypothetical protein